MKKKILIIISLLILVLVIIISVLIFMKSKELKIKFKKNLNVNINDEFYNTNYIRSIKNGTIITKRKLVDTSKTGIQKITITVKNYFNKKNKYTYELTVVDKDAPTIEFKEKLETEEGKPIDLLKNVIVKDNSNEEIKATVEGDYDFNVPLEYHLVYSAKDSSGNEKRENFILEVTKKKDNKNYFTTSKGFKGYTENGITYIDGILVVNKTYSVPDNYNPGNITNDTRKAMNTMFADAKSLGLNIYLSSGFRSYNTQNTLYNNYVNRDGKVEADTYSARPGHSEHQTGLAFDVNQVDSSFDNTEEAKWLHNNCYRYGFILRYPKGKTNETGYIYESWHFRYVGKNLASILYNNGDWITLENYFGIDSKYR